MKEGPGRSTELTGDLYPATNMRPFGSALDLSISLIPRSCQYGTLEPMAQVWVKAGPTQRPCENSALSKADLVREMPYPGIDECR